jgi:alpha-tubulin suppressor-like RCC1 family protein
LADDPTGGAFVNSMLGVGHVSAGGVLTRLTASPTSPDDGQKATQVPLAKSVSAITSDAAGQLYFITATGAKVRRIATNGIVGTAAGTGILDINNRFTGSGGAAISATLPWMTGLAVGSDGSILVASGTQVASVRPDHKLALIAGNGVYLNSGDNGAAKTASVLPSAVAESGGSVYIAGVTTKMCGAVPFTYVCPDKGNLRRVSPNGVITTVYVSPNLVWSDMTALPDGTIALISDDGKALVFVNPVTKVATVVATPTAYNLGSPHLYADSAGTLFVSANLAAVKRTASGAWSAIAGGASGGITGDDAGTVYLNEYSTIVKYLGLAAKKADPAQVSAGASHSCIRLSNSTVKCWGANGSGQLGNGSVVGSRVPLTVPGLSSVGQVSAGAAFTCAVVTPGASGTVKCWGANSSGQLGSGSTSASTVPVVVQTTGGLALKGVSSVATGDAFACAVSSPGSNGTVRCWGKNASGQLGDNTTTNRTRAVQVRASATVALKGVTSVAAGGSTACATLTTGSVRCWGANNHGQLGRGNTVASKLAVQVSGIDGIAAKASKLEIGDSHTCAVLTTRAVRCWGLNTSGQLGDGTTTQRLTPVAVTTSPTATLSGVTAITAGGNHTCAILGAGVAARVRCWGSDASGQLGNTRTGNKTRAVAVAGTLANGTSAISAGVAHTVAVVPGTPATTKDVAAWGSNWSGQLGDGTATGRATPMRCPYL